MMARNRSFVPDLGSVPGDDGAEVQYVCAKYSTCRDRPVEARDFRSYDVQYCRTHGLPVTTPMAIEEG